jgi:iron(III) transport system permease protein
VNPWGRLGRYGLLGALVLVVLYPTAILVYLALWSSPPGTSGHPTLAWFHDAFTAPGFNRVLVNTGEFAVIKAALAALIGGGLAFLVARTDIPARRAVAALASAPFFVPVILTALAWAIIANPKTGMLNEWFVHQFGATGPVLNIYSIAGMLFQATPITAAMFFLLTLGAFNALNPEMEEAAQICGASRFSMIRTIVVPIMAPALTGAAILSLIRGIESFETPYFLGTPGHVFVLSTEIYRYLRLDTPPEPGHAGALSVAILAVTILVMLVQWKLLAKKSYVTIGGRGMSTRVMSLGRWRWPIFAGVLLYIGVALGVPLLFLVASSFTSLFGVFTSSYLTTSNWSAVLHSAPIRAAYVNTLLVAFAAGGIGVFVAGIVVYIRLRSSWWGGKAMDFLTWLPWAMPGMVMALGFLWAAILMPGWLNVYGTLELLIIAFVVTSLPVGARVMSGIIGQIGPELEEAARICGANWAQALYDVVFKLVRLGAIGAWVIIAYGIVGNLTLPVLLSAPGTELLSVQLLQIYSDGNTSEAAVLAVIVLLTMAALLLLVGIVNRILRLRMAGRPSASMNA